MTVATYPGKPLRVVQISDSHLFKAPTGKLLGLNTEDSLQRVLSLVRAEQPKIDLILVTGDVSQDGSRESYHRFQQHIDQFGKPVYWLPGNHDELKQMQAMVSESDHISPCKIDVGPWRIILLDSTLPGKVPGELGADQLDFLAETLKQSSEELPLRHVMVCLHHHPIPLGSRWLDGVGLKNPEPFLKIVDCYPQVRAVVYGHVHQAAETHYNQVSLYAAPSTCVQFKPKSAEFAICDSAPGYRWFDLFPSGAIQTGVSRAESFAFELDYSVKGY